jgi:hypothetical protein
MSDNEAIRRQASELFGKHIHSNHMLDNIEALDPVLPDDAAALWELASRCLEESRKASRAGRHLEAKRLGNLGRQLEERAEHAERRKQP